MKLSDITRNLVDSNIRAKGKMYSDWNQVKILSTSDSKIDAKVQGSGKNVYDVTISIEPGSIIVNCTCPFFESYGACKHVWATILTAEKNGFESTVATPKSILIEKDLFDEEDDEDFEDDFFLELDNPGFEKLRESLKQGSADSGRKTGYQNVYEFTKRGSSFQKPPPDWKTLFSIPSLSDSSFNSERESHIDGQIYYEIKGTNAVGLHDLKVRVFIRKLKEDGEPGLPSIFDLNSRNIKKITDEIDRQILAAMLGANDFHYDNLSATCLNQTLANLLFPRMIQTGRCYFKSGPGDKELFLSFDESKKWELSLSLEKNDKGYLINHCFKYQQETKSIKDALHINETGYVFWNDGTVNPIDAHQLYSWINNFIDNSYIIPINEAKNFILSFKELEDKPPINYPEELDIPEVSLEPKPFIRILGDNSWKSTIMNAELNFMYDQHVIRFGQHNRSIYDSNQNKLYLVNHQYHRKCLDILTDLDMKIDKWNSSLLNFKKSGFLKIIYTLLDQGWQIEAWNGQFKKPGNFSFSVNSGIDWFEVKGTCEYEGETVSIPDILDALKKKKEFIELNNGKLGILPAEWLSKYGRLAAMGTADDDTIRFKKSQTLLVDLLLADQPDINCDEVFKSVRNSLRSFTGVTAEKESGNFCGTLREYQREGLGWLSFLKQFGFGGCLADDMGLGKTIQVLALLEKLRDTSAGKSKSKKNGKTSKTVKEPSLIVTPRSLIYNWHNEAARFTPDLKILDHSHSQRSTDNPDFSDYDLVLVTYGTLIRDIETLRKIKFNYVILDEAQVIKNANTISSKSVRLLNGANKLALSGTPVENHLSDLWSIFEFLNPGILGSATVFKGTTKSNLPDENEIELIRKALRPFILRRTKSQVASDLPEKTEELIICEMDQTQRKIYDQLKKYYQSSLKEKINKSGLNRSKIHILEALLRLRQAACHPGLIDKKNNNVASTKLETLIAQLQELKEEGHKSLVFSQFTSMLDIILLR